MKGLILRDSQGYSSLHIPHFTLHILLPLRGKKYKVFKGQLTKQQYNDKLYIIKLSKKRKREKLYEIRKKR